MAETPDQITVNLDTESRVKNALQIAHSEGVSQGRWEIIDWLKKKYMDDDNRPDRDTPEAKAILSLVREVANHLRKLENSDG